MTTRREREEREQEERIAEQEERTEREEKELYDTTVEVGALRKRVDLIARAMSALWSWNGVTYPGQAEDAKALALDVALQGGKSEKKGQAEG
jgi:hypothetical protein